MDLLDTLGQVGTGLDKITGGRALRGLLAGKGREALSFIPFSDTMGLTDVHNTTSGRDLTDAYGLTSKGSTSAGAHALGFLADTALSPGNLLGGMAAYRAAPTIAKGFAAGAKAISGLDLFDHVGAGLSHLAGGGAEGRLGKFVAHDASHAPGGDLLDTLSGRRAASGVPAPSPEGPVADEFVPPHQVAQAGRISDAAKLVTQARDAQRSPLIDAFGGFMGDERGSLDLSRLAPNPIDTAARSSPNLNLESQSMNPRRFSIDPAKRQFYANWRNARYADRMGGRPVERFPGRDLLAMLMGGAGTGAFADYFGGEAWPA